VVSQILAGNPWRFSALEIKLISVSTPGGPEEERHLDAERRVDSGWNANKRSQGFDCYGLEGGFVSPGNFRQPSCGAKEITRLETSKQRQTEQTCLLSLTYQLSEATKFFYIMSPSPRPSFQDHTYLVDIWPLMNGFE